MQRKAARNSLNLLKSRNGKGGRGLYSSFLNSFKKNQNKETNRNYLEYNQKDIQMGKESKSLLNNEINLWKFQLERIGILDENSDDFSCTFILLFCVLSFYWIWCKLFLFHSICLRNWKK